MFLEVLFTDSIQKEWFEVKKDTCVVGRSPTADVAINNEGLSRKHFQIELIDGEFYVTDLNSTNGVVVNGEKLLPGVKTSYKPIFPLEIADRISIMVTSESSEATGQHRIQPKSSLNKSDSITRIKKLDIGIQSNPTIKKQKVGAKPSFLNKKPRSSEGQGLPMPVLGVSLLIIFGIAWYFMRDYSSESTGEEVVLQNSSLNKIRETSPAIPKINPAEVDFKQHQSANECEKMGNLCQTLGLTDPKEGIAVVNNQYIVYLNLEAFKMEEATTAFQKLPERERYEYLLGEIATHPALQEELKTKRPSHLLVIGFTAIDDVVLLKYLLNVSYKQLPRLDEGLHQYLFSEIFQNGLTKSYKTYVGLYTQMIDL